MNTEVRDLLDLTSRLDDIWVFGYGSLMWNPGFEFDDCRVGFVEGFTRKFWQGNTTHRGTPDKPGRVATLIEDKTNKVWGRSYRLRGNQQVLKCLDHLGLRECTLGGYDIKILPFRGRDSEAEEAPVQALTFIAKRENIWYLGAAPVETMANEILGCRGVCGTNAEYVLRIADFMRLEAQDEMERDLRELEEEILVRLDATESMSGDHHIEDNEMDLCGPMLDRVFRAVQAERIAKGQEPFQNKAVSLRGERRRKELKISFECVGDVVVGKDQHAREDLTSLRRKQSEG